MLYKHVSAVKKTYSNWYEITFSNAVGKMHKEKYNSLVV